MIRHWLTASVAISCVACGLATSKQDPRLDPPSRSQFEWNPAISACDPPPRAAAVLDSPPRARAVFKVIPPTLYNLTRSDELSFPVSEISAPSFNVQSSLIAVNGSDGNAYNVRLCAEAGAPDQATAQALLEKIRLTRDGNTVRLMSPMASSRELRSSADLHVTAPRDAPISISGTYAALAVHDVNAPIKLTTTHARITVLGTTADVDAAVKEFGIIDFSGSRGNVHLDAPTEINLNFIGQKFGGTLSARTGGVIRVLLPAGFASSLEADVTKDGNFLCRADICGNVKRNRISGRVVFSYGVGKAQIHLESDTSAIVLYSH